jgi:hypothetical protein
MLNYVTEDNVVHSLPPIGPGAGGWAICERSRLSEAHMPQYHFHVYDGRPVKNVNGIELPNIQAARVEALRLAAETIRDAAERADLGDAWRVEVLDEVGLMLFRMDFLIAESPAASKALGKP